MMRSMLVAAAVVGGAAFMGVPSVQAAPSGPMSKPVAGQSLVEKVRYNYCRRWYRECRARWGGGRDFRRCMRRHGC